jgi:hypothetical protein
VKRHSRNVCGVILRLWVFTKPTRAYLPRPAGVAAAKEFVKHAEIDEVALSATPAAGHLSRLAIEVVIFALPSSASTLTLKLGKAIGGY